MCNRFKAIYHKNLFKFPFKSLDKVAAYKMSSSSNNVISFDQVRYDIYSDKDGSAPVKWKIITHQEIRKKYKNSYAAYEVTLKPPYVIPSNIKPGMQIAIIPENNIDAANSILPFLNGDTTSPRDVYLPECTGYKSKSVKLSPTEILQHILDINRPIEKLLGLIVKKGKDLIKQRDAEQQKHYQALVKAEEKGLLELRKITDNYSLVDVLKIFPNIITLDDLINLQPKNANRKYTISDIDHKEQLVKFMFSATEHTTDVLLLNENDQHSTPRLYKGTATSSLCELISNNALITTYFDIRGFELPDGTASIKHKLPYYQVEASNVPVILVSTGVGISPHISWLRDLKRRNLKPNLALMVSGGRCLQDEILKDEIKYLLGDQFDKYIYTASQEGNKKYVQDILKANEVTWNELHNKNGVIFVCGTDIMGRSVENMLEVIGNEHGVNGKQWLKTLYNNGQYHSSTSSVDRFYRKKNR